jgi:hypothetical protein
LSRTKGAKDWTLAEVAYLERHRKPGNGREIAAHLGRSHQAVLEKASLLGLQLSREPRRFWTKKECRELRFYAGIRSRRWIAKRLKRTPFAVRRKAGRMGLSLALHRTVPELRSGFGNGTVKG